MIRRQDANSLRSNRPQKKRFLTSDFVPYTDEKEQYAHALQSTAVSRIQSQLNNLTLDLKEKVVATHTERKNRNRLRSFNDYYMDVSTSGMEATSGDERLALIERTFMSYSIKPWSEQRRFLDNFVNAILPQIYGDEWDGAMSRVLRARRLNSVWPEVMINAPRQIGKTTCVALWVATVLLCVPGIEIAIFSTGSRASENVLNMVTSFIQEIDGASRRIVKRSSVALFVAQRALPEGVSMMSEVAQQLQRDPTTSRLMSFPDNPKGMYIFFFCFFFAFMYGFGTMYR